MIIEEKKKEKRFFYGGAKESKISTCRPVNFVLNESSVSEFFEGYLIRFFLFEEFGLKSVGYFQMTDLMEIVVVFIDSKGFFKRVWCKINSDF